MMMGVSQDYCYCLRLNEGPFSIPYHSFYRLPSSLSAIFILMYSCAKPLPMRFYNERRESSVSFSESQSYESRWLGCSREE